MSDFHLDELIHDAFAETTDHFKVWEKVRAQLDAATVWQAIEKMGPDYCRNKGSARRRDALSPSSSESLRRAGTPRKAAAFADRWEKAMKAPLPLSKDGKTSKALGDCDLADVIAAADIRREIAEANATTAARFEALAEKMRCHRASTVRDLPQAYFAEAMGW